MMRALRGGLALALALLIAPAGAQTVQSTSSLSRLPIALGVNPQSDYAVGIVLQTINGLPVYITSRVPIGRLQGPVGPTGPQGPQGLPGTGNVSAPGTIVSGSVPLFSGTTGTVVSGTPSVVRSAITAAASGANTDITSLSGLTTALPVTEGGSGATTAAGARTSYGAAASGANSDITALSGLTTPLSVGQGGTGATTATGARTSLSAAASGTNTDITSLASPALGAATATTQAGSDSSAKVATTAQVQAAIGLIPAGSGAPSAVNPQSAGYTALASDKGKVLSLTGSATLTLGSGTAAAGWYAWIKKTDGNGVWAITPASGTIDGLASIDCYQESYLVWYDAANSVYRSQDRPKGWINIGQTVVSSAVAAVNLTVGFTDAELRDMQFDYTGATLSAAANMQFTVSKSGANVTSGYVFNWTGVSSTGAGTSISNGSGSGIPLDASAATAAHNGGFTIGNFGSAAGTAQRLSFQGGGGAAGAGLVVGEGYQGTAAAVQGVTISGASGNITAGTFNQRGFRP